VKFTDHTFDVPLAESDGERITLYAREITADPALPWLLFLTGGPGFPAPRPLGNEGWLLRALKDYRVLLLDQRGTGRSTPVRTRSSGMPRRSGPRWSGTSRGRYWGRASAGSAWCTTCRSRGTDCGRRW
jgi:pimeloyl-ACP methyl ester carboxylesterase